jgi:Holliday junction resolvase RusA-like endonuclease
MWTPSSADDFKTAVALAARESVPAEIQPIDCPWQLAVVFYLPRPKRLGKEQDTPPCAAKPDIDNLVKAAVDAIVAAGVAKDDAPLWALVARKVYCEYGDAPRAEFVLTTEM